MPQNQKLASNADKERSDFSERLQQALRNAHYPSYSPTRLSREFNVRFSGRPITVHAARKWLVGEAIPTQEKVRALADWLGVQVNWLRFGGAEGASDGTATRHPIEDVDMMVDLQRLDAHHKALAREFIRVLVRAAKPASQFADRIAHWNGVEQSIAASKGESNVARASVNAMTDGALGTAA